MNHFRSSRGNRIEWPRAGLVLLAGLLMPAAWAGTITTVAGNGTAGSTGDGGAAIAATINYPVGVAVDSAGNLYIADTNNNRIRKVNTGGTISNVAGTGTAGYSGNGGAATSAKLNGPNGVAVDGAGNVYIADQANHVIRKVTTGGIISTVAGNGVSGFGGDGGQATSAMLLYPAGVALDSAGNLLIADKGNHRIRKVNTSGIISTLVGSGGNGGAPGGFSGDGGAATAAKLNNPVSVAIDGAGNLYIADYQNNRVRKVNASGIITTVAGNGTVGFSGDGGPGNLATLRWPMGVAVDGTGNLVIADMNNSRIRRVGASGDITTVAGSSTEGYGGDGGEATAAQLLRPTGVAFDSAGSLYISDKNNLRIRRVSPPIAPPTVTPSAGSGGTISPDTAQTVNPGETTSFTVTPNTGYSIAGVTGCGGSLSGNTYTTGSITGDCTVTASFGVDGDGDGVADIVENRYYVKADAAGASNGTSWANAFTKLADALTAAVAGDDIWVAKGVYYPDEQSGGDSGNAGASFVIPDRVQLYGGFAGTETTVDQRDWAVNKTILSGDIGQDDTDSDGNRISENWNQIQGSNSRQVVTTGSVTASTRVDGIIVTGGDGGTSYDGGGWYNNGGSPVLTNLIFQGNRGNYGGGLYSSGSPDLANVVFAGNSAAVKGGGLYSASGNPAIAHASFSGNSAGSAAGAGGGAAMQAGVPAFKNSILWGDTNGELAIGGANPSFTSSLIQGCIDSVAGWKATCGTNGGGNKDANPLFVNAGGGDLHLSSTTSPAWNAGDNALIPAGLSGDLGGAPRTQQTTVDMGAYEQTLYASPAITGSAGSDAVVIQRTTTTVNAGAGDDVIYNALGKQTLTGGSGADRFVYTGITDRTDIIEDFSGNFGAADGDLLDLSRLLASLGCKTSAGCNPLAAGGYVSFQEIPGTGVFVQIDIDGPGALTSKVSLVLLRNVTAAEINNTGNFVF